jgi:CRP-like cAMP-binding protein
MTAEPTSPRELLERTLAQFDCLDPTSLAAVVSAFKPRKVARDARLSRNGERCGGIGFVVEGVFVSGLVGPEKEALSDIFCEGDFATDYVSFLTGAPSTVDIVALEDSKTLWLTHADLQTLYATVPNAERLGRYIAEGQFISLVERTAALLTQSPAARYQHLLARRPSLANRVPQYLLARWLGVTPESLSRIRARSVQGQRSAIGTSTRSPLKSKAPASKAGGPKAPRAPREKP